MPRLVKGLRILNQVDSCVQIMIQETGETVLSVLGEVHLEKCIRDLMDSYAKVQLRVSKPIVQFRETLLLDPAIKPEDLLEEEKSVTIQSRNNTIHVKMIAIPLPPNIVKVLEVNKEQLKIFIEKLEDDSCTIQINKALLDVQSKVLEEMGKWLDGITADDVMCIGPKKLGTCILVNKSQYKHLNFWTLEAPDGHYDRAIINGFQSAVQAGPLCHETMHGVCFVLQKFSVDEKCEKNESSVSIIKSIKEACRLAFQKQAQRLVGPMYNLSVIANEEVLGECKSFDNLRFRAFLYFIIRGAIRKLRKTAFKQFMLGVTKFTNGPGKGNFHT